MILELDMRYGQYVPDEPRLRRFLTWIRQSAVGNFPAIGRAQLLSGLERRSTIELICENFSEIVDVKLAKRIYDNIDAILKGERTGIEVVLQDDLLSRVYKDALAVSKSYVQLARLLDLIGHRLPNAKILEIGAGTGASTHVALNVLSPKGSPKRYGSYTFTDVSSAFLHTAQATFSTAKSMDFKLFDMTRPPDVQDFSTQFDLIIASECLHTSPDIFQSLRYIRNMLKPDGRMVIIETTKPLLGHNITYSTTKCLKPPSVSIFLGTTNLS
jgi:SAM-dependent methyltransferase